MRAHGLDGQSHPIVGDTALGLLRDPRVEVLRLGRSFVDMTPEIAAFLQGPQALIVTKASARSRVHRPTHLDYIEVKLYTAAGALSGEMRIVGLFAATAYSSPAREVPYLRGKVAEVVDRAGLDPTSHAGRTLIDVLETYPRDDLFQIDVDRLHRFALPIMNLADRPRIRVLSRPDRFGRFVSLLVYVPKDRYARPCEPASAPIWRRSMAGASRPPTRPSPRGRWRAPTSSSASPARARGSATPRRSRPASPGSSRPGATACARRSPRPFRARPRGRWRAATRTPSR